MPRRFVPILSTASAFMMLALLSVLPAKLTAQVAIEGTAAKPAQRIRSVTLTGNQACPKAARSDEIIVCSRIGEPYRIPKELRQSKPDAANQSWVNRAATMDEVGRVAAGLPDTCSPVGSGGHTGCTQKMLADYAAERAQKKREQSTVP